jgi:hypothetical protein
MAAVSAGVVLRSLELPDQRLLLSFYNQLTTLIVSALFVLLSANLSIPSVFALGWGGVLTVVVLMVVVRPLSVLVCTWQSGFSWRQKAFLAWCAPRGIIAASVASLFAILLTERGITGGEAIKALVFLTIGMTVFFQGLTAKFLAQLLGLRETGNQMLIMVGANPLSILVARIWQGNQQTVKIVDSSADACNQAEAFGIQTFVSSGLDMGALARAGLDSAGTLVTLTPSTDVNLVVAQRSIEEFRPHQVLAVYAPDAKPLKIDNPDLQVQPAFADRVSLKAWNQYMTDREIQVGTLLLEGDWQKELDRFNLLLIQGAILPLLYMRPSRSSQFQVVSADIKWEEGDQITYILHTPRILPQGDLPPLLSSAVQTSDTSAKAQEDYLQLARELLKNIRK